MNTSLLPSIDTVRPFDKDKEREFLKDMSHILHKHDMLDRIGICLLHRHFDLNPNELLVETTDAQNRVSTTNPTVAASFGKDELLETMWKIEHGGKATVLQYCGRCGND